jgi:hypothetical protein
MQPRLSLEEARLINVAVTSAKRTLDTSGLAWTDDYEKAIAVEKGSADRGLTPVPALRTGRVSRKKWSFQPKRARPSIIVDHGRQAIGGAGDSLSSTAPLLAASFIAMAAAGWNWAKATEYRRKKTRLDSRERELAADLARVEREGRSPRLFPPRVYELTRSMLDHAALGDLDRLAALIRGENQKTCQLVLDQCIAVADCIVNGRSASWPPSEADLRMIAAITSSCMENPQYSEARAEVPAAIADPVVYDYLSRAVVRGDRVDDVFPDRNAAVLAVRITAAMLVAFLPGRPWQGHLELIWKMETEDGVNCSALRSAERRLRRTSVTSTSEDDN